MFKKRRKGNANETRRSQSLTTTHTITHHNTFPHHYSPIFLQQPTESLCAQIQKKIHTHTLNITPPLPSCLTANESAVSLSDILALVEALKEMPNKVPEFPVAIADEFKHLIPAVAAAPPYDTQPVCRLLVDLELTFATLTTPPLLLCDPTRQTEAGDV